jgi:hypothetical protein
MNTTSGIITLKISEWSKIQPQCFNFTFTFLPLTLFSTYVFGIYAKNLATVATTPNGATYGE